MNAFEEAENEERQRLDDALERELRKRFIEEMREEGFMVTRYAVIDSEDIY